MNNKIEELKKEYRNIDIPNELELVVQRKIKQKKRSIITRKYSLVASITIVLFAFSVNISPNFAYALSDIPILKSIVKVVSIRDISHKENNFEANIETPYIKGLDNKELSNYLNTKYLLDNKRLYVEFLSDISSMKESGFEEGYLGVDSGYRVLVDNEDILVVERYVVNVVGSSSTQLKYDTIDKKNQILITLPSLFEDEEYINIISDNIKEQMKREMELNEDIYYFLNDEIEEWNFKLISKDNNFYISEDKKLIISFDKYEVAPGYMGSVEFEIPTNIIAKILVSDKYIR